jgi:hypothetical protein
MHRQWELILAITSPRQILYFLSYCRVDRSRGDMICLLPST